jgi:hypothetical protein
MNVGSGRYDIPNLNFSRNRTSVSASDNLTAINFVETENQKFKDMSADLGTPGYSRPSSRATALIYQTVYGGQIVSGDSPCGNCSFTQSFVGPSYNCTQIDPVDPNAPWCQRAASHSDACGADFVFRSDRTNPAKIIWYEAGNATSNFTSAWNEGAIWVRHTYLPQEYRTPYINATDDSTFPLSSAYQIFAFKCEQWNTRFDIRRTYADSSQLVEGNYT